MLTDFQGQPANANSGQPANRSVSQAPAPNSKENPIAEITESVPLLSPISKAPLQVSKDSEPGTMEQAPDLGRFPFQRRRPSRKSILAATELGMRSKILSGSDNENGNIASENTLSPSGNVLGENAHSNASPSLVIRDPNQNDPNPNRTSQSQQGRLSPQIVHVRGVGPEIRQDLAAPQDAPKKGTIWPEGSGKWALAEAARRALTSGSVNAGRAISVNEIVKMLDQNPSYTELCEKLELRGFIIDRGHFARLLLSAVSVGGAGTGAGAGASGVAGGVTGAGAGSGAVGVAGGVAGLGSGSGASAADAAGRGGFADGGAGRGAGSVAGAGTVAVASAHIPSAQQNPHQQMNTGFNGSMGWRGQGMIESFVVFDLPFLLTTVT